MNSERRLCKWTNFFFKPLLKITLPLVSFLKRTENSLSSTTNSSWFFFVLLLSKCTEMNDWEDKLQRMDGFGPNQFKGVHRNDIPLVENLVTLNILLCDIDIVDGNNIGELSEQKRTKITFRLLGYNNHICYVGNNKANFQFFLVPIVTPSSKEHSVRSGVLLFAVNDWRRYFPGMYTKFEKLSLKSWILLVISTLVNKNSSKT